MTTLIRKRTPQDARLRDRTLPSAGMREVLGSAFSDPVLAPTTLAIDEARRRTADGPELSVEELRKRYGHLELEFAEPMTSGAAEILAEGKRDERARQLVIERGPQGVGPTVARFGAALAGAAVDPINIAASFIPVAGQARWAALVGRLGLRGALAPRFARGFAAGAVGNAAVEPLVYSLTQQQQLDYTINDALVNVAFGGLLGGTLAGVAGARLGGQFRRLRSGALKRLKPATQMAAFRAGLAQLVLGKRVDIESVLRADTARPQGAAPHEDLLLPEVREGQLVRYASEEEAMNALAKSPAEAEIRVTPAGDFIVMRPANVGVVRTETGAARTYETREQAEAAISQLGVEAVPVKRSDGTFVLGQQLSPEMRAAAALDVAEMRARPEITDTEVSDIARQEANPARDALHDPESLAPPEVRADRSMADDTKSMLAEVEVEQVELQRMADEGELDEAGLEALQEIKEVISTGNDWSKALEMITTCMRRR